MRALVFTGPEKAEVQDVPEPVAAEGQVVVEVGRAGVCGTDVELFTGEMSYLHTGQASYPLRPGHEWSGTVIATGPGVDPSWHGRRVTGDTMIGCGDCRRCLAGRHHICASQRELGIQDGLPGALAEQVTVPVRQLLPLPYAVDDELGALVEPGGNALRCVEAALLSPGERLLVIGTGAIGRLVAMFARARGAEVHLLGEAPRPDLPHAWTRDTLPDLPWDAVVDASNGPGMPALAVDLVEPGRRVVYIGLSGTPSHMDTRTMVLKDVTTVGILGASAGLAGTIDAYAQGLVDPRPLIGATISLEEVADVFRGHRPSSVGPGPKILVDPHRTI
ncbi:alcohol dehydrogenase catalytic domain-containing protein [Actinoplanes sp. NPDC051851]|uniref:zinc-dependent alcohol dehydrogenase n=1 Tax=Actinoplanes sp. NPDC051851 TaxID=3154753 RepID=UPI0034469A1B